MCFQTGSYNPVSVAMNTELIEKIERMSKLIHLILVKISASTAIISPLSITFANYFIYGMGDESFYFDATLWFPFDPNKPVGFFAALIFQSFAVFSIFCCLTPIIGTFIASCWCIVTFLKDIVQDVSDLKKKKMFKLKDRKLTDQLCNFVRFHGNVEELSEHIFNVAKWQK